MEIMQLMEAPEAKWVLFHCQYDPICSGAGILGFDRRAQDELTIKNLEAEPAIFG
jgi:hypothetical protein